MKTNTTIKSISAFFEHLWDIIATIAADIYEMLFEDDNYGSI